MEKDYGQALVDFLNASPCNFYAVKTVESRLVEAGYRKLNQSDKWNVKVGDKFYVTKNDSAIFAFNIGTDNIAEKGFRLVSAHSDSPTFRIKPNAEMVCEGGVTKLNTEVYGGPILYTWFDRPLSAAGRVLINSGDALKPETRLVNFKRPIMVIPHLAIHFNRAVNEGNHLSKQKDMLPIIGIINERMEAGEMLINLICSELGVEKHQILDFDLLLYPVYPAMKVGIHNELICGGRIDDLSMAHAGLEAFLEADNVTSTKVLAIFDNEETGSGTKQGAASPVLANMLQRIVTALGGNEEDYFRALASTFLISADNGHALHPNYVEKQDPTNHPILGGGPIIKINANCKYMTDAASASVFKALCQKAGVPVQYFVNHSDVAGGSTLGNILTSQIDINGVDVGNPILAMHSCCETGTCYDQMAMIAVFRQFYNE